MTTDIEIFSSETVSIILTKDFCTIVTAKISDTDTTFDFGLFYNTCRNLSQDTMKRSLDLLLVFRGNNHNPITFINLIKFERKTEITCENVSVTATNIAKIQSFEVHLKNCLIDEFPKFERISKLNLDKCVFENTDGLATGVFDKYMKTLIIDDCNLSSVPKLASTESEIFISNTPITNIPVDSANDFRLLMTNVAVEDLSAFDNWTSRREHYISLHLPNLKQLTELTGNVRFSNLDMPNLYPNAENVRILNTPVFTRIGSYSYYIERLIKELKAKGRENLKIHNETKYLRKMVNVDNNIAKSIHEYLDPDEKRVNDAYMEDERRNVSVQKTARKHGGRRRVKSSRRAKKTKIPRRVTKARTKYRNKRAV